MGRMQTFTSAYITKRIKLTAMGQVNSGKGTIYTTYNLTRQQTMGLETCRREFIVLIYIFSASFEPALSQPLTYLLP